MVEEARFPLVTLHYGTVLGWMLCSGPYTGTSLVQLPTTVITNTESSPVSPYSNLVSCSSTGLLEPKPYTFKYKNKLLLIYLNDRPSGMFALMLSSRRVLADEGTPVRQRVTTDAFPESFVP